MNRTCIHSDVTFVALPEAGIEYSEENETVTFTFPEKLKASLM